MSQSQDKQHQNPYAGPQEEYGFPAFSRHDLDTQTLNDLNLLSKSRFGQSYSGMP
jgi:hypothetical protein